MALAKVDICVVCDQPSKKSFPLHKCATCGNAVHRKCATTTTSSHTFNCMKCTNNKKEKVDVDSVPKKGPLTKGSNTPTINQNTVRLRNASHSNISNRRSNTTGVDKTTSCKCIDNIRNELSAWENKIQENLNSFFNVIKQHNDNNITSILNEIKSLKRNIEPTSTGMQQTTSTAENTYAAKQNFNINLHDNNYNNLNNIHSIPNSNINQNSELAYNNLLNLNNSKNKLCNDLDNIYSNNLASSRGSSIIDNFNVGHTNLVNNHESCISGRLATDLATKKSESVEISLINKQNIGSINNPVTQSPNYPIPIMHSQPHALKIVKFS